MGVGDDLPDQSHGRREAVLQSYDSHLRDLFFSVRLILSQVLDIGDHVNYLLVNRLSHCHGIWPARRLDLLRYAGRQRCRLGLYSIAPHYSKPPARQGSLLGCAALPVDDIEAAMQLFGRCLDEIPADGRP
ncbi:MAG: hypothetical protein ACREVN_03020 [Gammaproteobacteria bacterium]